ncbi:MAG TPA: TolC family protein, partial [Solirubrobacterales bacterium]|nr:TolC family protein [Solirubrobacterales bacterium]
EKAHESRCSPLPGDWEGGWERGTEGVRVTLAEALERARATSPRLDQLEALRQAAVAGLAGARAERMPRVDLAAGYTRNSDVPEFTLNLPGIGSRTLFPNIPDNWRAHAGLSLPLWTAGRIEGGIAAAGSQLEAAGLDVSGARSDLLLETRNAYWSLVTARASARVLAEALESYEAHLTDARNRFDFGVAARNEILSVQVERDRAELSRLAAENAAEVANANLVRLTGLPPGTRIDPVEPLEDLNAPATPEEEVEALVVTAEEVRPELAALQQRIEAARAAVGIRRAGTRPQAGLSLGYDYARPNPRILPPRDEFEGSWSAGVSVSLNAFDGGRTAAAVAQAEAQVAALESQLEEARQGLRLEVTARLFELRNARATLAVTNGTIEAARENLRVARDRYREGVIPSAELLDAETALLRAGLDQTDAATRIQIALARLERAAGR